MPQLIIAIIVICLVIWLAAMAFGVALAAIPSCIGGMIFGGGCLLIIYQTKIAKLTSKEKLSEVIDFSISGSKVNWHLKNTTNFNSGELDPEVGFCALLGAVCAGIIGYFIFLKASQSDQPFFAVAIVISAFAAPVFIVKLRPRRIYERWLKKRVSQIMTDFDSTLAGIDDLRELEASIRNSADQLGIAFPIIYAAEVEKYICSHQSELVFNRAAFSEFMDARLQSARDDNEGLEQSNEQMELAKAKYNKTVRTATRSGSIALVQSVEQIHSYLNTTALTEFLCAKRWSDFKEAINEAIVEMQNLSKVAENYENSGPESNDAPMPENGMSRAKALQIFGLEDGCSPNEIKKAYREECKKWNIDQRQHYEQHVRKIMEERFKDVNEAKDFLLGKT